MEFKKYGSLENTYQLKLMADIYTQGLDSGGWVVTEKIHGANYAIYSDGEVVLPARRTGFIGEEKFFNHTPVFEKYKDSVLKLSQKLGKKVRVVGELFGGNIQKEVYYKDEQDFVAFDIFVEDEPVPYHMFDTLCRWYEIPKVPLIRFCDSLEEALAVNNEFETWLSDNKDESNICEGVVIKPEFDKYFANGNRLALKNKNDKFNEKKKVKKIQPKTKAFEISEGSEILVQELKQYVTVARLVNIVSKIGEVSWNDFGKLQGLMFQDLVEDYNKEFEVSLKDAHKDDWKGVHKSVTMDIAPVIREYLEKYN